MNILLSVIIPTYNPDTNRLAQTLKGLRMQTLPFDCWELIIIDNNSSPAISVDFNWQPNARLVKEPVQGLTNARVQGFNEAKGDIIIMVDDDNILSSTYLADCLLIFKYHKQLGAIGGRSLPQFEGSTPEWLHVFYDSLALRDMGNKIMISKWEHKYPACAPIGAGMAIRKKALEPYIDKFNAGRITISDRKGGSLASGGDNDMVLEILKAGWDIGYFPELTLRHIIPTARTETAYLSRLIEQSNTSWIQLLHQHGINPWEPISKFTVPLRIIKSYLSNKAWHGPVNFINWRASCGTFKGLAKVKGS